MSHGTGGITAANGSYVHNEIGRKIKYVPAFCQGESYYYSHRCQLVTAQAISRRLPTAAARVRAHVRSCGICGGQSGTGAGFLRLRLFPLPILIPPIARRSSSTIRGWYNAPISGRRTKWTQSHPTPTKPAVSWVSCWFHRVPLFFSYIIKRSDVGVEVSKLLGFWTSSIVWYSKSTREHNVSETGSVSLLRWGRHTTNTGG
jgi:hypothetical protein